jgi:formate hydrogenlyase subunit 3/multisubunit Na+/H+ antiporter MnhD subunit
VLTLVVGSVLAVEQTDVKRMLAYSSISHAGFILVALVAAGQRVFVLCSIGTDYCGPQFCRLWIGGHYFFVGSHVWGFGGLAGQSKQGLVLAAKKEIEGDKPPFYSALMGRS